MISPTKPRPVTSNQIKAVAKFLPELEAIAPESLARAVRTPEGAIFLGCVEYHPAVRSFEKACYDNGLVQPFDWPAWASTARKYMRDPNLVASARFSTCIKLLTAHLRAERYCDGHLQVVLSSGHINAILRRLQAISKQR
jgi:Family of unknown function (DUF6508)